MNTKLTLAIDKICESGVVSGSEIFGMGKEFDGDVPKFCWRLRDIVFDADIPERRKKRIIRLLIEARRKYKKWSYLNDRKDTAPRESLAKRWLAVRLPGDGNFMRG